MSINTLLIGTFDDEIKSILFSTEHTKNNQVSEEVSKGKIEKYENRLRNLLDLIENFSKSESIDMNYFIKKTFSEVDFLDFFTLTDIYIHSNDLVKGEFNLKNLIQIIEKSIGTGVFQKGSQLFEIQFLCFAKLVTIEVKKKERSYQSLKALLDCLYDLIKDSDEVNSKKISNSGFGNDTLSCQVTFYNEIPLLKTYFIHWYLLLFLLSGEDSSHILSTAEGLINLIINDKSLINIVGNRQILISYISFSAILIGSINKSSTRNFLLHTISSMKEEEKEKDSLSFLLSELLSSNNHSLLLELKNKSREVILKNPFLKSTLPVFDLSANKSILKNMIFLNSEIEVDYVKRLFALEESEWSEERIIGFISEMISLFSFEVEIEVNKAKSKVEFRTCSNWYYENEKDGCDLRRFRLMTETMKSLLK